MNSPIKVVIAGPRGKMGTEAVKMVLSTDSFELVGLIDRINDGKTLQDIHPQFNGNQVIYTNVEECFQKTNPHVLIDLTIPESAFNHAESALQYGIRTVIGTTGLREEELHRLEQLANEKELGCIIAPNFAIGAVLMMKFSEMAAKYFNDIEIIEMHHDRKLDAPSGTAIKTAQMIQNVRESKVQGHPDEVETLAGARGADFDGMRIHSVRLKGLIAHQQVMFGSLGESLTIRHDSYNRESFMTGLKICVNTVMNINHYVYGLENILE